MQLLTLPPSPALATSIRATAQVFEDPKSQALLAHLQQVAPSEASVLIIGETGTGKELVARHIHNLSARRNRPFVAVNCGAFSESLVEAELFGHEKGAFTGALSAKAGWFDEANGGTLVLDEIAARRRSQRTAFDSSDSLHVAFSSAQQLLYDGPWLAANRL